MKLADEPTILLITNNFTNNLIREAKFQNLKIKLYNQFIDKLEKISKKFSSFYFVNLNNQFSIIGKENIFDKRNWYYSHCKFSSLGLSLINNSIDSILDRHLNAPCKVLALDCDNTIWGGVLSEDGAQNILIGQDGLGQVYSDFQKKIKMLQNEGTILCLLSKNNEQDVLNVLTKHQGMILKKEDISSWKINWNEKHINIKLISEELNLGLDSFVFWDDNPIEREKMKKFAPSVKTIDVPENIIEWPDYLDNLSLFSKFIVSKDDKKKSQQYKSRANFIKDKNFTIDEKKYLKSIKLKPKIFHLDKNNISRAAQLCAKTNQFNLRTIRYTEKDLTNQSNKNKEFNFMIGLKDIYGDHGMIGLVNLKKIDENYIFLDNFLMSCRILGRHLESWIIKKILDILRKKGHKFLIGEFIPTNKNQVVKNFFKELEFTEIKNNKQFSSILSKIDNKKK